jgi:signal recognition particle GTPase
VIGKALPGAPHAVWLVLDATTGQNAMQQAKAFKEAVGVTGVILSKLDSSARGGMAFAIQRELACRSCSPGLAKNRRPDSFRPGCVRRRHSGEQVGNLKSLIRTFSWRQNARPCQPTAIRTGFNPSVTGASLTSRRRN